MNIFTSFFDLIFHVQNPIGQTINYLIIGLFLTSLLLIVKNWTRLKKEQINLEQVKKNNEEIEEAKTQNINESKDALIREVSPDSIIVCRVKDLFKVRFIGRVNHDAVRDILISKEELATDYVRYVVSIFLVLGLTGTVLGLSEAIFKLRPLITGMTDFSGITQVIESLGQILSGMKTAFSTTICGLIATLILTFINFLYSQFQSAFMLELEEFSTFVLAPMLLVPEENEAALKLSESLRHGAEELRAGAGVLNKTQHAISELVQNMVSATRKVDNGISDILNFTVNFKEGVSSINNYEERFIKMGEKFSSLVDEIKDQQTRFEDILKPTVDAAIKGAIQEAMKIVGDMATQAREGFKSDIKESAAMMKAIDQSLHNIKDALSQEREVFKEEIKSISGTLKSSMNEIIDHQAKELEEYFKDQDVKKEVYQEFIDNQTSMIHTHKESMDSFLDAQGKMIEELLNKSGNGKSNGSKKISANADADKSEKK